MAEIMSERKIYKALAKADYEIEKEFDQEKLSVPASFIKKEERQKEKKIKPTVSAERESNSRPRSSSVFQSEFVAAEQFRKLRTTIIKSNSIQPTRTILVTSAIQGEGKSFVARNLAIGFAHDLHLHSLLVDCDLRNPSQAPKFGIQGGRGISDYLLGTGDISALLIKTKLEKLSLLTSGSFQGNPTELLSSKRMETLIQELKSRYSDRYVIIDSTPLLATSESEVLARLVDGIIMVIRAGQTPRETVEQAVSLLGKDKLLGFVLNDIVFKSSGLFMRYFGSDRYYYGYGQKPLPPQSRWAKLFRSRRKSINV
jgi:exopolysaccharide/PEP-CTERM locus tyrosine autokinase